MQVPRQRIEDRPAEPLKGAAARTHALMVATASEMMRRGQSPSVSEVAGEAGVSRSTAYRYFPGLGDMVRAVVAEALGPILDWDSAAPAGSARLESLYVTAFPRMFEHEATFRAALRQSLEAEGGDITLGRGHRRRLLAAAVRGTGLPEPQASRLTQALSLTFGIEAMIVLKDIVGLDEETSGETALWAARAMLAQARRDAGLEPE